MSTAYENRRHTTTGSLALALRRLAEQLDRSPLEIEPSLLIISIQVQRDDGRDVFAANTVDDLHVWVHPGEAMPEYQPNIGHYATPDHVGRQDFGTWIKVYGAMEPPARIVAEADAAERAECEAAASRVLELEVSADLDRTAQPMYPKGTPEYDAYAAELKTELTKFAAGEPPYEYPPALAAAFMTPDAGGDVWNAPTAQLPVVTR